MKKQTIGILAVAMSSLMAFAPVSALAAEDTSASQETAIIETVDTDNSISDKEMTVDAVGFSKYICNGDNVNVRSGPGTSYSSIGKLSKGTVVRVRSISDGWAKIKFGTQIGYVYSKYLTKQ